MPISSNRRQRVIEFATPKVADLVVVERVDTSKYINSSTALTGRDDPSSTSDDLDYGDAHPDTVNFPNFKLALIKNGDNDQGQFQDWYYVKDRANQDDYNWEFQAAGAGSPRFDTVVRTYVTLRSAFNDASPALDSLYVIEQHVFVRRVTIRSVDTDKQFPYNIGAGSEPKGNGLISKETLYHKDEDIKATVAFLDSDTSTEGVQDTLVTVDGSGPSIEAEYVFTRNEVTYTPSSTALAFWGVDELGIMREGKQLSDNWYALSERQVIRKDSDGLVAEYFTNQNMSWPAVFSNLYATVWNRRDGGKHTNVYPVYKRESYSGPTKTKVQIYWQKAPFSEPDTVNDTDVTTLCLLKPMEPMEMEFVTPNWRVKTKPSLHGSVTVTYTNGTEDPVWDYGGYTATWQPTNYIDWCHPEGGSDTGIIVISDSQEAFRGGYLRTKVTAYKPNITTTSDTAGRHVPEKAPPGPTLDS